MTQKQINKVYVYLQTLNAALGLVFWMYTSLVFNSCQIYLQDYVFPDAATSVFSLIASGPQMGGIPGALLAGPLSQKIGRRRMLIWLNIIALVGVVLTIFESLPAIIVGRFIQGFVIGAELVMVPMYVAEMSPVEITGETGALYMLMSSAGTQLGFVVGFLMPSNLNDGKEYMWRILFGAAGLPNVIRLILLLFVFRKETPFYFIMKDNDTLATDILSKIYSQERIQSELQRLHEEKKFLASKNTAGTVTLKDLFTKKYRKCFFMGLFVSLAWSVSGMNTIFSFSNAMLEDTVTEPDSNTPVLFSTLFGEIDFVACIIAYILSKTIKRKTAFLLGMILVGIVNSAYGILGLIEPQSPVLKYILIIWPLPFEFSIGFIVSTYLSESLPEVGLSVTMVTNNLAAFLITQFYLSLADTIGHSGIMLALGVCCFLSFFISKAFLVETKNKSKAEILSEYSGIPLDKTNQTEAGQVISLTEVNPSSPSDTPTEDKLMLENIAKNSTIEKPEGNTKDGSPTNPSMSVEDFEEVGDEESPQRIRVIPVLDEEDQENVAALGDNAPVKRLSKRMNAITNEGDPIFRDNLDRKREGENDSQELFHIRMRGAIFINNSGRAIPDI